MADNYLERQYAEYERRKAGKTVKPADRKRFYTRAVVTKTHEQRQQEIAEQQVALADGQKYALADGQKDALADGQPMRHADGQRREGDQ